MPSWRRERSIGWSLAVDDPDADPDGQQDQEVAAMARTQALPAAAHHRTLLNTVRRWTREVDPGGHAFNAGRYGWYRGGDHALGVATLGPIAPAQVIGCIAELADYAGHRAALLWLDEEEHERRLRRHLAALGCIPAYTATYLAHDQPLAAAEPPAGASLETGGEANLTEFVSVKCRAFMATEHSPSPERLHQELERRRREFRGNGRFLLARVAGQPAGVVSWFQDGGDCFLNLLAVRVPFRRLGLGLALVRAMLARCYADGARAVMVVPEPAVARLYRQAGFTTTVCQRRAYRWDPEDVG